MNIEKIPLVLVMLLNVSFIASCSLSGSQAKKVIFVNESSIVKESIGVNGMTCVGCEVTLEDNIGKIEGVVSVKASHTEKEAIIEFDSTKTDLNAITQSIKKSGYKPFKK